MQRALLGRKKRIIFMYSQKVAIVIARCTSGKYQPKYIYIIPMFFLGGKTAMMNPGLVFHHISRFQPSCLGTSIPEPRKNKLVVIVIV